MVGELACCWLLNGTIKNHNNNRGEKQTRQEVKVVAFVRGAMER